MRVTCFNIRKNTDLSFYVVKVFWILNFLLTQEVINKSNQLTFPSFSFIRLLFHHFSPSNNVVQLKFNITTRSKRGTEIKRFARYIYIFPPWRSLSFSTDLFFNFQPSHRAFSFFFFTVGSCQVLQHFAKINNVRNATRLDLKSSGPALNLDRPTCLCVWMLRACACARRPGARTKNWCSSDKKESVAEYPGRKIRFSELFIWHKKEERCWHSN